MAAGVYAAVVYRWGRCLIDGAAGAPAAPEGCMGCVREAVLAAGQKTFEADRTTAGLLGCWLWGMVLTTTVAAGLTEMPLRQDRLGLGAVWLHALAAAAVVHFCSHGTVLDSPFEGTLGATFELKLLKLPL